MTRNTLSDLNNHLFAQLERLNDEDLEGDSLKEELKRADGIGKISKEIIDNARLQLSAIKVVGSGIVGREELRTMLGAGNGHTQNKGK